jgi:hypothetical protein
MRHLVDPEGREWRVYEWTAGEASPVAGTQSLIFDGDGIVRRVWRYPEGWKGLSDDALLGLMETLNRSRRPTR